jgi:hypothetical protein
VSRRRSDQLPPISGGLGNPGWTRWPSPPPRCAGLRQCAPHAGIGQLFTGIHHRAATPLSSRNPRLPLTAATWLSLSTSPLVPARLGPPSATGRQVELSSYGIPAYSLNLS